MINITDKIKSYVSNFVKIMVVCFFLALFILVVMPFILKINRNKKPPQNKEVLEAIAEREKEMKDNSEDNTERRKQLVNDDEVTVEGNLNDIDYSISSTNTFELYKEYSV